MALPQVPAFRLKPPLSGVVSGKFLSQSSRADCGWFCCWTVGLFFFKHICWASGRAAVTLRPQASARQDTAGGSEHCKTCRTGCRLPWGGAPLWCNSQAKSEAKAELGRDSRKSTGENPLVAAWAGRRKVGEGRKARRGGTAPATALTARSRMGALLLGSRRRTPGGGASEGLSRPLAASPLAHRRPQAPLRFCHLLQDLPQLH